MQHKNILIAFTCTALMLGLAAPAAQAFCGVIQESNTSKTVEKAMRRAEKAVRRKVRDLQSQYGSKLVLDEAAKSCIGGALAIDANGVETEGPPSCTVTQPFCVNP